MQLTAIHRLLISYLCISNVSSFLLFAHDKRQAKQGLWRVKETTLHNTALVGGWVGGFLAIQTLKHKNRKQEFLLPYIGCACVNAGLGALLLWNGGARMLICGLFGGGGARNAAAKAKAASISKQAAIKQQQIKRSNKRRW